MKPQESLVTESTFQPQTEIDKYRKLLFTELGFEDDWAGFLVGCTENNKVTDKKGKTTVYTHPLHWTTLKRLLDAGNTHGEVLAMALRGL